MSQNTRPENAAAAHLSAEALRALVAADELPSSAADHLAGCAECATAWDALSRPTGLPAPAAPPALLAARLVAAFTPARQRQRRERLIGLGVAWLAMVVLGAAATSLGWINLSATLVGIATGLAKVAALGLALSKIANHFPALPWIAATTLACGLLGATAMLAFVFGRDPTEIFAGAGRTPR